MSSPSRPAIWNDRPNPHDLLWSRSEKAIARKAFDAALKRELHEIIQETDRIASHTKPASGLWELEHWLSQRRKGIDRKYDYRYSPLTRAFGRLLREGRLKEEELRGLDQEKLKSIRSHAKFLAEDAVA